MTERVFTQRLPAGPESIGILRRRVVACAEEVGATDASREAIGLATSEALTNVVMHAYIESPPGDICVKVWRDGDRHLLVQVADRGVGLRPRLDSRGLGVGLALNCRVA